MSCSSYVVVTNIKISLGRVKYTQYTNIGTYLTQPFATPLKSAPKQNKERARANDTKVGAPNDRAEPKNEGKMPVAKERKSTMWVGATLESVGASDERVEEGDLDSGASRQSIRGRGPVMRDDDMGKS